METLDEKIEQARATVRGRLRKQLASTVPNDVVGVAEEFLWHESIGLQVEQSRKKLSELPDEMTVELYIARAAEKKHVGAAVVRALARSLDRSDDESIGQRVRARSRDGRHSKSVSVPQTTVAGPKVKGQWSVVIYISVLVLVLVVYVVERTKQ
jgi:hypothetical protein